MNHALVPAAEPEPPLDFAALTPDFYAAPRRVRFLCRFGVVEMIEVLENMIYWRLQGLQGQFWRGPSDSRMAAVLDIANRCRVSGRAADFRLIGRRRAA